MIVTGEKILDYIPQRPPVVMVDTLVSAEDKLTVTAFSIPADNIFVQGGLFTEAGLVENIAQSAALSVGYLCRLNSKPIPVGFIGAVKNLIIKYKPECCSRIETTIKVEYEVLDASIIHGIIQQDNNLIAECDMKIFLKPAES